MKRQDYDRALEGVPRIETDFASGQSGNGKWIGCWRLATELKQPVILYGMREGIRSSRG